MKITSFFTVALGSMLLMVPSAHAYMQCTDGAVIALAKGLVKGKAASNMISTFGQNAVNMPQYKAQQSVVITFYDVIEDATNPGSSEGYEISCTAEMEVVAANGDRDSSIIDYRAKTLPSGVYSVWAAWGSGVSRPAINHGPPHGTLAWTVAAFRTKELYARAATLMQEGDQSAASRFAKDNCQYLDKGTHGVVEDSSSDPTGNVMCLRPDGDTICLWVPAGAVQVEKRKGL